MYLLIFNDGNELFSRALSQLEPGHDLRDACFVLRISNFFYPSLVNIGAIHFKTLFISNKQHNV